MPQACRVTDGLLTIRLTLPESISVLKPAAPSGKPTIHTGVATAWPLRRNVVSKTYFSSQMATSARYPSASSDIRVTSARDRHAHRSLDRPDGKRCQRSGSEGLDERHPQRADTQCQTDRAGECVHPH